METICACRGVCGAAAAPAKSSPAKRRIPTWGYARLVEIDTLDRQIVDALRVDGRAGFSRIAEVSASPTRRSPVGSAGCAPRRACGSSACPTATNTSIAHLAGALGKTVWIMLSYNPDWRWLLEGRNCPWYPSARLFRQQRFGDWTGVIDQLRTELQSLHHF